MYLPSHFQQLDVKALQGLMQTRPFATLVTHGAQGLDANPVPMMWVDEGSPHGLLRGHVARANPVWRDTPGGSEVLAIFHGPDAYISPSWYETKRETGRVVPTWNYLVVQARGPLRVIDDASWLRELVTALTNRHEHARPHPWAVDDAPADYIDAMLKAIVGIEIALTSLQGKWKASQNHPERNRHGAAQGVAGEGNAELAAWMGRAVETGL